MQRLRKKLIAVFALVLIICAGAVGNAGAEAPRAPLHESMMVKSNIRSESASYRIQRIVETERKEAEAKQAELDKQKAEEEARIAAEIAEQERLAAVESARQAAIAAEVAQAQESKRIEQEARSKPVAPVAKAITGDKYSWLAAAGVPQSDWQYADYIVTRESSWNPNAVNPNGGACGLGQQLPCGKWPGAWNDPVAALRAQYNYVKERYGGYAGAYSFWTANHWY